jgi:hypothetical protein
LRMRWNPAHWPEWLSKLSANRFGHPLIEWWNH